MKKLLLTLCFTLLLTPVLAANPAPAACGLPASGTFDTDATYNLSSDCVLSGELVINANITVNGNGYTIDGNGFRIFDVGAGVTLRLNNVILSGGDSLNTGGGINSDDGGTLIINQTQFINNRAFIYGGAIYMVNGTASITDSTFDNNYSNGTGGAINALGNATVTLQNTILTNNSTAGAGGVVATADTATITFHGCLTSSNNTPADFDGAVTDNSTGICTADVPSAVVSDGRIAPHDSTNLNAYLNNGLLTVYLSVGDSLPYASLATTETCTDNTRYRIASSNEIEIWCLETNEFQIVQLAFINGKRDNLIFNTSRTACRRDYFYADTLAQETYHIGC